MNPKKFYRVRMKEEFEGGVVVWCGECVERDSDFIAEIIEEVSEN